MVRMNVLTDAIKSLHAAELTKKSVFIPRSKFPHRHDAKVELAVQEDTQFAHTYLEQQLGRKPYVIHDGPPFSNGAIHLGHAINKILKDIAARYAMITGHKVEFITGWDCHGLPIELQVYKMLEEQQRQNSYGGSLLLENSQPSVEHFRAKARAYAKSQIDLQMASFKRLGLLTDWNKRYTTDDPSYVANQLRAFSQLYEQKLIFKDLMPVYWSLVNRTSVAEADIDYKADHISKSAYVLYEVIDPPFLGVDMFKQPVHALVWTTTPWTLLENKAIAFNKQETYCIVKAWKSDDQEKNILISYDTMHKLDRLLQTLGYQFEITTYVPGKSLSGLKYKPLLDDVMSCSNSAHSAPRPFLEAEFVDGAKGTGLVHTAPNYGFDDFTLIRKSGINVTMSLVDHGGKFRPEAGDILAGKYVLSDGTKEILNILDQQQALLSTELTQHSYPYETRTQQPVIIRTSQQIFMDTSRVIPRCLKALESCSFYPEHRRRNLINMLSSSPNWCISRQRAWGTPIPVFYDKNDINLEKMVTHPALIEYFCKLLYKKRTMDYWWTADNSEIVPQDLLDKCKLAHRSENLVRGLDIFDVWSDSGLSWHTTTNGLNDNKSQADLYLEGVDQIRGWFSSSSILSMALRGCLPTKRFFLHGFALDETGRKMSKSQGNVVDPAELFESYGVDPVRLWAARTAGNNNDIRVKRAEFNSMVSETINKIRNTLKYLIGALLDHDTANGQMDHTKLRLFDQYYLDKLYRFAGRVDEHYKTYRYDAVVFEISRFLNLDLSPIYITTIKDLLYCDQLNSERRKSCLTVLNITYNILLRCLYPIVPHIVHEAFGYMRPLQPLTDWQDLAYKAAWRNDVLHDQMETLVKIRSLIINLMGSRFDGMRNHDAVLYISDKKLIKRIAKIVNSEPDLMVELFKTVTFNLSHRDNLSPPESVQEVVFENENGSQIESIDNQDAKGDEEMVEIVRMKLLSSWTGELRNQEVRVGGSFSINQSAKPVRFEICYKVSDNRKCTRCRRFTVLDVSGHANICDRCREVLNTFDARE